MKAGVDGDLDLRADAVVGGDENRVAKAGALETISASAPGRRVARTSGLMASTMALPASISTPACA
jgi:hypothetical protein